METCTNAVTLIWLGAHASGAAVTGGGSAADVVLDSGGDVFAGTVLDCGAAVVVDAAFDLPLELHAAATSAPRTMKTTTTLARCLSFTVGKLSDEVPTPTTSGVDQESAVCGPNQERAAQGLWVAVRLCG